MIGLVYRFAHAGHGQAHERSLDTDVLFGLIRRAQPERPDLKVVVMSATLDVDLFRLFFRVRRGVLYNVAVAFVGGVVFCPPPSCLKPAWRDITKYTSQSAGGIKGEKNVVRFHGGFAAGVDFVHRSACRCWDGANAVLCTSKYALLP